MTGREHPNRSSSTHRRPPAPTARIPGPALVVAAEILAASLLVLPGPARAEGGPAPSLVDNAAALQLPEPGLPPDPLGPQGAQGAAHPMTREEITALMPLIVTLPEHKKLAARLIPLIRQGDFDSAQRQLSAAIESGTLATILIDWLRRPGFLEALQALGVPEPPSGSSSAKDAAAADPAANSAANSGGAAVASDVAAMNEALDRQRGKAEASARDLATVTEQLKVLKSQHEQELASATNNANELQKALEQERGKAETATRQLAALTSQFTALKTAQEGEKSSTADNVAGLQAALDRQRVQAEASARDLAATTQHFDSLRALREREAAAAAQHAQELQNALDEQRARAESLAQQLAGVTESLRNLQAERERAASSSAATVSDLRSSLARERERRDVATSQLASVLDDLRTLRGIKEAGSTPLMFRLEKLGVGSPLDMPQGEDRSARPRPDRAVEQTGSVEQVALKVETAPPPPDPAATKAAILTARVEASAQAIASAAPSPDSAIASAALRPSASTTAPAVAPPAPAVVPVAPPPASADDRLTQRGDALFRQGDISGARLLLQRAEEDGSAHAIFLLAQTFDPQVLSERGVIGIRSDAAKARELYRRALAKGVEEARPRLEALR